MSPSSTKAEKVSQPVEPTPLSLSSNGGYQAFQCHSMRPRRRAIARLGFRGLTADSSSKSPPDVRICGRKPSSVAATVLALRTVGASFRISAQMATRRAEPVQGRENSNSMSEALIFKALPSLRIVDGRGLRFPISRSDTVAGVTPANRASSA